VTSAAISATNQSDGQLVSWLDVRPARVDVKLTLRHRSVIVTPRDVCLNIHRCPRSLNMHTIFFTLLLVVIR